MNRMRFLVIILLLNIPRQLSAMDIQKRGVIQTMQSVSLTLLSRLPSVMIIALAVAGLVYASRKSNSAKNK